MSIDRLIHTMNEGGLDLNEKLQKHCQSSIKDYVGTLTAFAQLIPLSSKLPKKSKILIEITQQSTDIVEALCQIVNSTNKKEKDNLEMLTGRVLALDQNIQNLIDQFDKMEN